MKQLTTISELELLRLALSKRSEQLEAEEARLNEHPNWPIAKSRSEKYAKQIVEMYNRICELDP